MRKVEQWEMHFRDILTDEFKYTAEQAERLAHDWASLGHPGYGVKWGDLWGHAYLWAEGVHEDVMQGAISA